MKIEKRARQKTKLKMVAGIIQPVPSMAASIIDWNGDMAELMVEKQTIPASGFRVPVVCRVPSGDWYWMGKRALSYQNGSHRVSIVGGMVYATPQRVEIGGMGFRYLWVVDMSAAGDSLKFHAPYPLETVEDSKAYLKLGVDGAASSSAVASLFAWRGFGAVHAAENFRDLVLAVHQCRTATADRLREMLEATVFFPEREKTVARMSWDELAAMFARMEREQSTFREREAQAVAENAKLRVRLESLEGRTSRMIDAQRKIMDAEITKLKAEVSRLADLVI